MKSFAKIVLIVLAASAAIGIKARSQILVDTSNLGHCATLINIADSLNTAQYYQQAYDAYKTYIESCASLPYSWKTFSDVGAMNAKRNGDIHRSEEYREWLKKVLYYNLDTNYYCADLGEIQGTFGWFNDQRGNDYKGFLTFEKWVIDSSRCRRLAAYLNNYIQPSWDAAFGAWYDTVKNPTLTPFDSTLPSLDDLGLGILRGQPADVKNFFDLKPGPIISNIIALENPFSSETKIDFTLREAAAIKMEIYDVLGRKYYSTEKVYDEGDNQIILPGTGLPHGILYARFSASDGTVKTISLRHLE